MNEIELKKFNQEPTSAIKLKLNGLPQVLLLEIAIYFDIYTLLIYAATSKRFQNLFQIGNNMNIKTLKRISLINFPFLSETIPHLLSTSIDPSKPLFSNYADVLHNAWSAYCKMISSAPDQKGKLREKVSWLLTIGNFGASAVSLNRAFAPQLLGTFCSIAGGTILRRLNKGFPQIQVNPGLMEAKPDKELLKTPLFESIFDMLMQTEFKDFYIRRAYEQFAWYPPKEEVAKKMISSVKFIKLTPFPGKPIICVELEPKIRESILRLYVISYSCRQFNIFIDIHNLFIKNSLFLSNSLKSFKTVLDYCVNYGEMALAAQLLKLVPRAFLTIVIKSIIPNVIEKCDSEMLCMLKAYDSELTLDQAQKIIQIKEPLLSRQLIEFKGANTLPLTPKDIFNLFFQIHFFGISTVKFFLENFKSLMLADTIMDILVEIIVEFSSKSCLNCNTSVLPSSYFQDLILLLIGNKFDLETVCQMNSESLRGKTLVEIAAYFGIPEILKILIDKKAAKLEQSIHIINSMDRIKPYSPERHPQCLELLNSSLGIFKNKETGRNTSCAEESKFTFK